MSTILLDGMPLCDLKAFRNKLQKMWLGGIIQSSFQGQTIIFRRVEDIKSALSDVQTCIAAIEDPTGSNTKKTIKRITMTSTKRSGF